MGKVKVEVFTTSKLIIFSLISFFMAVLGVFFIVVGFSNTFFVYESSGISVQSTIDLVKQVPLSKLIFLFFCFFILTFVIICLCQRIPRKSIYILYKYRFFIALLLLIVCVCFEVSGSSISYLQPFLPGTEDTGALFRSANPYRSDEFAVNTILAIAQGESPNEQYAYFSDVVRGTSTDMFIVYGQPVKSIGAIFRPFHAGYLLMGSAKGLSFFWCARLIVLLLVSFELGMFLLKGRKKIAFFFAILISISPVVIWWYAVNGLVEMLIFGQLCALMLYKFFEIEKIWKKYFYALVFFWSGGSYVLTFYPAWQVVLGYAFLALFIWIIWENRNKVRWKKEIPILLISGIVIGIILGCILYQSKDTIEAVLNTAYPGKRISIEKLKLSELFYYGYNLFLPFVERSAPGYWVFFDFFPSGILLGCFVLFFQKCKDSLLKILIIINLSLLIIYTLPVPVWLLKITLLSHSPAQRAIIGIGYLNILILFRAWSLLEENISKRVILCISLLYALLGVIFTKKALVEFEMTSLMTFALFAIMMIGGALFLYKKQSKYCNCIVAILCFVLCYTGALVNPIQKGLDFIFQNDMIKEIKEITKQDEGKWIVEGMGFPGNNIPLLAGAPTVNSTNVYPQVSTWKKLDRNDKYREIYNRYAHISIDLVDNEDTSFNLIQADCFNIKLKSEDLKILEVEYILSPSDLSEFSTNEITISKVNTFGGLFLYKVSYNK